MISAERHKTTAEYLSILIAMSLPFFVASTSWLLGLLSLNWLVAGQWKSKMATFRKHKNLWWPILLFMLYILSLSYTSNTAEGLSSIQKKLSFLVFPLIYGSSQFVDKTTINKVLSAFIASCFVATALSIGIALWHFLQDQNPSIFFYRSLSNNINIHAIYFSIYILFALITLIISTLPKSRYKLYIPTWLKTALIPYFFIMIMLLASKITVLMSIIIILFLGLYFFMVSSSPQKWRILIVSSLFLSFSAIAIIKTNNPLKTRFETMINSDYRVLSQEKYSYDIPFTGTTLRLLFWKFGKEIITEQKAWLYGVGVGDSQEFLDKKMIGYNLKDSGYLGYNFHSQYIETIVEIGLIGLTLLAFILISFFRKMLTVQNIVGIILVIIVATLFLTESALEKHRGIVFLMFFISILSTETKLET